MNHLIIEFIKISKISNFLLLGVYNMIPALVTFYLENDRLKWTSDKNYIIGKNHTVDVLLMPMQIRTFIVNVLPRQ